MCYRRDRVGNRFVEISGSLLVIYLLDNMRHEEQIRLGTTTTLDEPVSETIVTTSHS